MVFPCSVNTDTVCYGLQAAIVAIIAATLFLRTHLHPNSVAEGQLYSGFLFFTLLQMFFSGIAEMTFAVCCSAAYHSGMCLSKICVLFTLQACVAKCA